MTTHDDDTDPTGMRALLRSLPDPGPMPDDLVERIQSSIPRLPLGAGPEVGDEPSGREPDVSRGTSDLPRRSTSWWARTGPRGAVAAVVLLGGGTVAADQLGLVGSGSDSSFMSSDSSAAGSSGGRAESLAGGRDAGGSTGEGGATDTDGGAVRTGPVVVTMSGRSYTSADLAAQVDGVPVGAPLAPLTAESPGIGPIGTELGIRSCLVGLGLPRDAAATVDLALVDSAPGAVLVVTREGGRTAYAVGRDCTLGDPALVAGPVNLP